MDRELDILDDPFYSPLPHVLIKGAEEDGKWIVYLEASNELQDQDGEIVDMHALEKAKDYYLGHGVLSWDHKHKMLNDPKYIIGEPLDVRFSEDNRTLVKGFLYKHNKVAQSLWDNIQSGAKKLGASIGGGVLNKSQNKLTQIIWDETAITHKPVNDNTLGNVQIIPFKQFAKALMAGGGVNAENFTGGRALIKESLQGSTTDVLPDQTELTGVMSQLMQKIVVGEVRDYNDMVKFIIDQGYSTRVARRIINYIAQNMPNGA